MDDQQPPPDPADVPVPLDGVDDPAALLNFARDQRHAEMRAARQVFLAAAVWADMHSEDTITDTDWIPGAGHGGETAKPVAGAGCPLVAEFSIAEFAVVIGKSPDAGRRLIGQAVETRHRLPHLWAQVVSGRLEAWKAAKIADTTMPLSRNAAAFVDAHVAPVAARVGTSQLGRLVGEAIARFDPTLAEKQSQQAADGRCANLRFGATGGDAFTSTAGTQATVALDGVLDYADARDLDQAIHQGAADLAALGSTDPLDVRRAQALGTLARADLTLDLTLDLTQPEPDQSDQPDQPERRVRREPQPDPDWPDPDWPEPGPFVKPTPGPSAQPARPARPARPGGSRQVVIYAHLAADAITSKSTGTGSAGSGGGLARVEGHGWVTVDQVRARCGPDTQVVIKPVIDTDDCITVDAYEIPTRLAEQVIARDPTCVFPWCHRSARGADCDHITPHATGGPTCSCNLAPLCRRHHRLKTHTGWTYDVLDTASYLWTTPHGHRLHRDPSGTTLLDRGCGCQQPKPEP